MSNVHLEAIEMSSNRWFSRISKWGESKMTAFIAVVAWLCLWYLPWQGELRGGVWLQLAVGLAILVVPGACIYGLLNDRPNFGAGYFTFGFVISHFVFAILGTIGRILHLPFETTSFFMMMTGSILIFTYVLSTWRRPLGFNLDRKRLFSYALSALSILLISLPVILIVVQRVLNDDDLTYLAYLTNWQHSIRLDFNDQIFGLSHLSNPRFWFMSVPFAQALLAELSGVPGILILAGYYEPFLVFISVISWYELAVALKFSPRAASASVVLQLLFLLLLSEYLHPGSPYFSQLSADKATAAFIIAPVFLRSLIKLLEIRTRNNAVLLLLTGLSLTFMHPVVLAYSVFIAGMLVMFYKGGRGIAGKFVPMAILVALLVPQIVIRFIRTPATEHMSFDPEVILTQSGSDNLVSRWRDTQYYGFNPDILTVRFPYYADIPLPEPVLSLGWLLIPLSSVLFALKKRDSLVAQFVLSAFILCFLTYFPFTGWIFGYFLNARMLARSVWLFPFGLSAIFLVLAIRDHLKAGQAAGTTSKAKSNTSSNSALVLLTVLTMGIFLLYMRENNLPDFEKFKAKSQRYQGLAVAGQELDRRIPDQAYVIGSENLNDLIPGISSKSKLIVFRISQPSNMPYFSEAQRKERISDVKSLFSRNLPAEDKMLLLEKYDIRFLFLQSFDLRLFEELTARYPERTEVIEVGGVILLQIDG
jgi:hypothetical protein